jgi:hypothetical protein
MPSIGPRAEWLSRALMAGAKAPAPLLGGPDLMGKVILLAIPTVEPPPECSSAAGDFSHLTPWAAERLRELRQQRRKLHAGILERAAVVAQVFGMPELAEMNVEDASNALVELTGRRSDVCAVLQAYYGRTSAAEWKAG